MSDRASPFARTLPHGSRPDRYAISMLISSIFIISHTSLSLLSSLRLQPPHLTVNTAQYVCRIYACLCLYRIAGVNPLRYHERTTYTQALCPERYEHKDRYRWVYERDTEPQIKLVRQKSTSDKPTTEHAHASTTAPRSIGRRMRRRGITIPTHRAHIPLRRRRADMLI